MNCIAAFACSVIGTAIKPAIIIIANTTTIMFKVFVIDLFYLSL